MKENKKLITKGIVLTVQEWYNLLQDDIHKSAIEEMRRQGIGYRLLEQCNSLHQAIDKFDWGRTEKGYEFWASLSKDISKGIQNRLNDSVSQHYE